MHNKRKSTEGVVLGLGVCIELFRGILAWLCYLVNCSSAKLLEASAIMYDMKIALKLDFNNVIVENDSLNVIHAINCK